MNAEAFRKLFEFVGGGASALGGLLGYFAGQYSLGTCIPNTILIAGTCPAPEAVTGYLATWAMVGAAPGAFIAIVGLAMQLLKK